MHVKATVDTTMDPKHAAPRKNPAEAGFFLER